MIRLFDCRRLWDIPGFNPRGKAACVDGILRRRCRKWENIKIRKTMCRHMEGRDSQLTGSFLSCD